MFRMLLNVQGEAIFFTRMNIQAQPAIPLIPSMFKMAAARRPENAPDKDAAEKNRAILRRGKGWFSYIVNWIIAHIPERQLLTCVKAG